jgi:hypothetical protein
MEEQKELVVDEMILREQERHEETRRHFDVVVESIVTQILLLNEEIRTAQKWRYELMARVGTLEEDGRTTRNRLAVLERKKR